MTLRGTTGDFPLESVVGLLTETTKTGELLVRGGGKVGALGFAEGRLVAAVIENEGGENALGAIFAIPEADFEFTPWASEPEANLEPGDLASILKRAADARDRLAAIREAIPDDRLRFKLSAKAADQGTVTLTPDRWRALLMVDGERDVLAIAGRLGVSRMDALSVLAGLVKEGVVETLSRPMTREHSPPPQPAPHAPAEVAPPSMAEPARPAPTVSTAPPRMQDAAGSVAPPVAGADWILPSAAGAQPETTSSPPAPAGAPPSTAVRAGLERQIAERFGHFGTAPQEPAPPPRRAVAEAPTAAEPRAAAEAPTVAEEPSAAEAPTRATSATEVPPEADDRLDALTGRFMPVSLAPAAAPLEHSRFAPPAAAEPVAEPQRPMTPKASVIGAPWTTPAPAAPRPPANTWVAPPPVDEVAAVPPPRPAQAPLAPAAEAPAERKSTGFFGRFIKETPTAPASSPARAQGAVAGSPSALAAFSNALLLEYNSGTYGKVRIESRMANLLMRVDEQADPIDRPLPIVDDLIDTTALEREGLAEDQTVPYLATLVRQIYEDAERAFGKDKAKKGYKVARQQVFGGDANLLNSADLAGKLPRV